MKILKILALQSANSITVKTKIGKYQTQELFLVQMLKCKVWSLKSTNALKIKAHKRWPIHIP